MDTVTVVGTVDETGALTIFGRPIAVHDVPKVKAGQRVRATGTLLFTRKDGAFLQMRNWEKTDDPESNACMVSGTIMGILPPKTLPGGKRTACIVLQQNDTGKSRLLLTVVGSRIAELGVDNLSTGQQLTVRGYINYHRRGLHVLYAGKGV